MKKSLSIKITTLLLVCLTFLLVGTISLGTTSFVKADEVHQVTFMLDETTVYETQNVADSSYASVPETPHQAGKIFEYWEDENGNKFSFKTKIQEDKTLTARWQLKISLYTVKFCVDGKVINEQIVKEGQTVIAPVDFDCGVGKEFDGWDTSFENVEGDLTVNALLKDKEYTVTLYGFNKEVIESKKVKHGQNFELPTIPTVDNYEYEGYTGNLQNIVEDGEIYLNYAPVEYTVTFTIEGKPFEMKPSESVKYGQTVSFPGVALRLGYVFMGWFTDLESDTMYDFATPISSDIELKAKLVPVIEKFEVKFYDFDNNQYGGTQVVEDGKSAILPGNPYKEGYEFVGWNEDYQTITQSVSIHPIFKIKNYTVKFFSEDELISEQQVNYGDSAIEPDFIPEKQGYDFIRWDKNFNRVSEDLEIHAVFEEKTFVVMFYSHEMKKIGATQFVKYGQSAIAPNLLDREGYDFIGWDGDYTNVTEDVIFIAQYLPQVYTIEFYYQDQKVNSQEVEYGNNVDFYIYELEGYLFYGWYLDQGLTQPFSFNTKLTTDVKVYAKMQEKPAETFTVIFKGEDGSVISSQTIEKGASAILPASPFKQGYDFAKWEKESGNGEYDDVQNDLVYVATYTIKQYKVTFCYGTQVYDEQQVAYGQGATAPANVELEGHTFKGWDKEFDSITGELVVNAIFEANQYQVIFKYDVDGEIYLTQTVKYGQKVSIPKSPQKEGFIFKNWQMVKDDQMVNFSFDTVITGETVIVANFEGKPYTVYYYVNGELYHKQQVLFNNPIPEIDDPNYGQDYEFTGWSEIPETMPAKNVTITGTMLKYYNVYFVVNGETFSIVRVLEGQEIPEIDEPNYGQDYVFMGWSESPSVMPNKDLTITGTMLKYYNVYFVIDGREFKVEKVLEGDKIVLPTPPTYNAIMYSFAWGEVPSVMPSKDVTINGAFELISADVDNELVFVVNKSNGKTTVSVYIRGKVNIGGMLVDINVEKMGKVTATYDENHFDYNAKGSKLTFVWAQGENLTEFTQLATFVFDGGTIELDSNDVTITAYAFNQDNVVSVNSSVVIINR